MNKDKLIDKLNDDFNIYKRKDLWHRFESFWEPIYNEVTPTFKKYYSRLLLDFAEQFDEVITTVFISEKLLKYIKGTKKTNVLVFTHHPLFQNQFDYTWTSFYTEYINMLKQQKISIYSCHIPLDLHSRFSTDYYFSKQLIENNLGRITAFDRYFSEEMSIGYYGYCKKNIDDILKNIKPNYGRFMYSNRKRKISPRINKI